MTKALDPKEKARRAKQRAAERKAKKTVKPKDPETKAPVAGTCQVCGCTEAQACEGGCSWKNEEKTLCSKCELPATETPSAPPPAPVQEQGPTRNKTEELAALIYYDTVDEDKEKIHPSFEKLSVEDAASFIEYATKIMIMIDKMGCRLVAKDDPALLKVPGRVEHQVHVERVILAFLKTLNVRKAGKHKTKQKLINPEFFPAGELAYRIVDNPYVKE